MDPIEPFEHRASLPQLFAGSPKFALCTAALLALVSSSTAASADVPTLPATQQQPPGPPPSPPSSAPARYGTPAERGYAPATPPPQVDPPDVEAGRHLHDGFYFHVAVGFGSSSAEITGTGARSSSAQLRSVAAGLDIGVGATPWPGVVLGGRLRVSESNGIMVRANDQTNTLSASLNIPAMQGMVDFYPWPTDGFHVMGAMGLAVLNWKPSAYKVGYDEPFTLPGALATGGVGWQGWIARQWSIGGLLTFDLGWYPTSSSEQFVFGPKSDERMSDVRATSFTALLSFEATLH